MSTNIAMCLGMFACQACCDCVNTSFKQQVRFSYFIFDAFFVGLGILILYGLSGVLTQTGLVADILANFVYCPTDPTTTTCFGLSSVFRLSLALVVMHLLVLFFLFFRNGLSKAINEEVWMFKILLVTVLFIGFFFINNSVFQVYSSIAMILSLFFLIFQVVMLIDLCYLWATDWVRRYDAGENRWGYFLLFSTIGLYGGTFFFVINGFHIFWGCGIGTTASLINLIFICLAAIFIFLNLNPDGSLLASSAISFVASYLTWSGLSDMEETCNEWQGKESNMIINVVFSLILIIVSLLYVSVGSSDKTSGQVTAVGAALEEPQTEAERRLEFEDEEELGIANKKRDYKVNPYKSNSFIFYHIIMILACCYVAMVLTNWGAPVVNGQGYFNFQASKQSMWIKIATSWVTMVVYLWTIVAPTLLPQRDFS